MEISSLRPNVLPTGLNQANQAGQASQTARPSQAVKQMGQTFSDMLTQLSDTQNNSDALLQKLAAGENVDIHQVMIASEQTDISFRVAMGIRDRLVDAYREISRMAV